MIDLKSKQWADLPDAYNRGADIPALLLKLSANPSPKKDTDAEPWFSLWSSLCHQGDVYPASFAAVPHIADVASKATYPFAYDFFLLPSFIEIERKHKNIEVPIDLAAEYFQAIRRL